MARRKATRYLLSPGCSKNTVDSESMAVLLEEAGLRGTDLPQRAEVLIVNTCGFIAPARDESPDALRELAAHKRPRPTPERCRGRAASRRRLPAFSGPRARAIAHHRAVR